MTKEYNCPHEAEHGGQACAGCLGELYEMLDQAASIMSQSFNTIKPTWQAIEWRKKYLEITKANIPGDGK